MKVLKTYAFSISDFALQRQLEMNGHVSKSKCKSIIRPAFRQGFPITFSVLRREIPDDEGKAGEFRTRNPRLRNPKDAVTQDPLDNFFNETKFVDLASQSQAQLRL